MRELVKEGLLAKCESTQCVGKPLPPQIAMIAAEHGTNLNLTETVTWPNLVDFHGGRLPKWLKESLPQAALLEEHHSTRQKEDNKGAEL